MKIKEFLSLKQGNMIVSEYRDKFIQLSRYALEEVADNERKHEQFMEGRVGPLQYQLISDTFPSFQRLLDKAIVGHVFSNAVNQEQGNTIVKDKGPSSSEALPPLGFNDHWTKVMKDMPSSCYK
jgi:hypothetical protein